MLLRLRLMLIAVVYLSSCSSTRTIGESGINDRDIKAAPQSSVTDEPTITPVEGASTGAWLRMLGMTHDRVAVARLQTDEIITWGAQTSRTFTNIKQIAHGLYHTVLLYDDGSVELYGTNEFGQLDIPDPQLQFEYIAAGETFTVGLTSDGRVVGWGRAVVEVDGTQYSITPYPLDVTDAVQLAVHKHYTLVAHRDGKISLWGDEQTKLAAKFDLTGIKNSKRMAMTDQGIFVIDAQQPHWFTFYENYNGKAIEPITLPPHIANVVALADGKFLLITETHQVYQFEAYQMIGPLNQTMRHDAPIIEMEGYVMGLDANDKFFMWHPYLPTKSFPIQMPNTTELSVKLIGGEGSKSLHTIYRFNDNSIRIYEHGVEVLNYPYEVSTAMWMSDDSDYFAVISPNGDTAVWGNPDSTRQIVPEWARPLQYIDLPTPYAHSEQCSVGILADGSFVEWDYAGASPCRYRFGNEPSLQGRDMYPRPPAEATQLIKVVRPGDKTMSVIGLRADGQVVAWGRYGSERPATVPSNATDVIDIVSNGNQIMALRRDGQIVVWDTDKGESLAPVQAMPSRMVRMLVSGNVSLRTDGTLVVWTSQDIKEYPGFSDAIDVDSYIRQDYAHDDPTIVVLHKDGTITHFGAVYALPNVLRIRMVAQ